MKSIVAVVFFHLGDSPASKFYVPTFRNILLVHTTYEFGTGCSKTSAHTIQTPGNHLQKRIQHSQHGESLNSRLIFALGNLAKGPKNKSQVPMSRCAVWLTRCPPVTRIPSRRPRSLQTVSCQWVFIRYRSHNCFIV